MRSILVAMILLWCGYSHASDWEVFRYDGEYTVTKILPQGDATVWLIMGGRLTAFNRSDGSLTYHEYPDGPSGQINELALANNGNLLTAGTGGVYQYDGHSWHLLFNPDNDLTMLFVTETDVLWAVSPTALYRYDGDTWELTATDTFYKGAIDNDGTLWFVTDAGLVSTSDGVEWISRYEWPTDYIPGFMYFDKENVLWMPGTLGLVYYDNTDKAFIKVPFPREGNEVFSIESVIIDNDAIWAIASGTAVFEISPSFDTKNAYSMEDGIIDDALSAIARSDDGTVWIGSRFGLTSYDGERFIKHIAHEDFFLNGVTDIALQGDTIWFGHHEYNGSGCFSYFRNNAWHYLRVDGYISPYMFKYPPPLSIIINGTNSVWLSGPSALNYYDYTSVTHYDVLNGNNYGVGGHPGDVKRDMYGDIWIVFYSYLDGYSDIWPGLTRYTDTEFEVKLLRRRISAMALFGDKLYFTDPYKDATDVGLAEITISSLVNAKFDESMTWYTTDTGLPSNDIHALGVDKTGVLWASRWHVEDNVEEPIEIYRRTGETTWDTFTAADIGTSATWAFEIVADSTNVMWFGTNAGVLSYDGDWAVYTTENSGLPHNEVNAIAVAPDNTIWFGTADGAVKYTGETITAIDEEQKPESLPTVTSYPNPFNPSTTISFTLPESGHANLVIYNLAGQKVRTLADEPMTAGNHTVVWDGRDDSGNAVAAGVYVTRLNTGGSVATGKMVLVK